MLGGLTVVFVQSRQLADDWSIRQWPTAEGRVIESRVSGRRAFHPEIHYTYNVHGKDLEGVSDLDVPGFGTKSNRLNVAERALVDFPAGKKITVHYHPQHPEISRIRVSVPMATFLFLTIGGLILAGGAIGLVWLLKNSQRQ